MEIDHFNSAARDQMDMTTTITEQKFPDFFAAYIASNGIIPHPQFTDSSPFLNSPPIFPLRNSSFTFGDGFLATDFPVADNYTEKKSSMAAMREMIFRIAAMQPIHIDPESVKPPKRRNVKISKDPQSVAARHRRERISERIRILQRLVPGGTKMDTASMLDEAIHYVKFLKTQVQSLERAQASRPSPCSPPSTAAGVGFPVSMSSGSFVSSGKVCQLNRHHLLN